MKIQHKRKKIYMLSLAMIFLGFIFFTIKPQNSSSVTEYFKDLGFSYLPAGSYTLAMAYDNPYEATDVIIYTSKSTDSHNQIGMTYATVHVPQGSGRLEIQINLSERTRSLRFLSSDLNVDEILQKVTVTDNRPIYKDNIFLSIVFILFGIALGVLNKTMPFEKYRYGLFCIAIGFISSIPYFYSGLVASDDLGFHLARLEGLYEGLKSGAFPVYINPLQVAGYGGLSATMYPDFFLYPFAALRFLNVSTELSYKCLIVCMNIATAVIAYISGKGITKNKNIGLIISILYSFASYRLIDVYFRASLGEALAMTFFPLLIYGIYEICFDDFNRWWVLTLAVTGIMESHVLSVEMCALITALEIIVWLFIKTGDKGQRILAMVKSGAGIFIINAFFLIPFLRFFKENFQCFNMPNEVPYSGVFLKQVFAYLLTANGTYIRGSVTEGEMPLSVGAILLVGVVLFGAFSLKYKGNILNKIGLNCFILGVGCLALSSYYFPYDKLSQIGILNKLITSLQFSWRFLGLASALLIFPTGIGFYYLIDSVKLKWIAIAAFALLEIIPTAYFFNSLLADRERLEDNFQLEAYDYSDGMYMYALDDGFYALQLNYQYEDACIKNESGACLYAENYNKQGMNIVANFKIENLSDQEMIFPIYYYPGYVVKVNGEKVECYSNSEGLLTIAMPGEDADIEVTYSIWELLF